MRLRARWGWSAANRRLATKLWDRARIGTVSQGIRGVSYPFWGRLLSKDNTPMIHVDLPVSIDYLYDVGEIAGVRPVRAVCEGTAVLRPTSTHPLGVRLEEA